MGLGLSVSDSGKTGNGCTAVVLGGLYVAVGTFLQQTLDVSKAQSNPELAQILSKMSQARLISHVGPACEVAARYFGKTDLLRTVPMPPILALAHFSIFMGCYRKVNSLLSDLSKSEGSIQWMDRRQQGRE